MEILNLIAGYIGGGFSTYIKPYNLHYMRIPPLVVSEWVKNLGHFTPNLGDFFEPKLHGLVIGISQLIAIISYYS